MAGYLPLMLLASLLAATGTARVSAADAQQCATTCTPSQMELSTRSQAAYCATSNPDSAKLVAEVQFEGNTAPFTTAALDKPIVVSWAGGTFELDAGLAFTSGTCTTQLSNYAAGSTGSGLRTVVCGKPVDWPANVPWPPPAAQVTYDAYPTPAGGCAPPPVWLNLGPRAVLPSEYKPTLVLRNTTVPFCGQQSQIEVAFEYDGEFLSRSLPAAFATAYMADGTSAFETAGVRCTATIALAGRSVVVSCRTSNGSPLPSGLASIYLSIVAMSNGVCEAARPLQASAYARLNPVSPPSGTINITPLQPPALACGNQPLSASFAITAPSESGLVLEAVMDGSLVCTTTAAGAMTSTTVQVTCPLPTGGQYMPGEHTLALKASYSGCSAVTKQLRVVIAPSPLLQLSAIQAQQSASCGGSVAATFNYASSEFAQGTALFKPSAPGAQCVAFPGSLQGCRSAVDVSVTCARTDGGAWNVGESVPVSLAVEYSALSTCPVQQSSSVISLVSINGNAPSVTITPQQPSVQVCTGSTSASMTLSYSVSNATAAGSLSFAASATVPQGTCTVVRQALTPTTGTLAVSCNVLAAANAPVDVTVKLAASQSCGGSGSATVQLVPVCCRTESTYAFAGAASTCIHQRLPNDTRCTNTLASTWGFYQRGPRAGVMRSGITRSCRSPDGQDVGTITATCESNKLLRFNLTANAARQGQQIWLFVGCVEPSSLPSSQGAAARRASSRPASGTNGRKLQRIQGCNLWRAVPNNPNIANAYQLVVKPEYTSFAWQLNREPCFCQDLYWSVNVRGSFFDSGSSC